MAASMGEDFAHKVLSDIHVHAQRQNCTKYPQNSTHDVEKTLSRFYFVMPFELKSESAGPTSTNSPCEDASFCETIVQKRASDSTEYSEKTAYIQKEKNFETDVSPSYRKQELDCDGDLIVSRRKPPCSSNVCCQRMAEYQSNSLMLCQCLNEEKSNPCQGVITIEHKMETFLKDVGYQLWAGALLMCDYLLQEVNHVQLKNSTVLDLGAGLGITSIVAAMFASCIICTDYRDDILAQAELNWHRNRWLLPQVNCGSILFRILDWKCDKFQTTDETKGPNNYVLTEKEEHLLYSANTILAAEVIYDEELTDAFFKTIYTLLLHPPSKDVIITLEKRVIFSTEAVSVCSPAYEHFHSNVADLVSVDEGPVRFCAEKISTNFPQSFQYNRTKDMELWKISSRFTDSNLILSS
ncbi:hypothetical protein RRG08_001297 [Elysia crispata]|uniref:Methyltransferase-like protein 22 n=1 Tax=Elysia crispata TaxID=231223 RepID=A0AAE1B3J8_9GAST|nr:hypothetical protein RRG08_001297 [Elysia crispata]